MGKKKKETGGKRSKTLRDKMSRLSDWKKKQRGNIKKFVSWWRGRSDGAESARADGAD